MIEQHTSHGVHRRRFALRAYAEEGSARFSALLAVFLLAEIWLWLYINVLVVCAMKPFHVRRCDEENSERQYLRFHHPGNLDAIPLDYSGKKVLLRVTRRIGTTRVFETVGCSFTCYKGYRLVTFSGGTSFSSQCPSQNLYSRIPTPFS